MSWSGVAQREAIRTACDVPRDPAASLENSPDIDLSSTRCITKAPLLVRRRPRSLNVSSSRLPSSSPCRVIGVCCRRGRRRPFSANFDPGAAHLGAVLDETKAEPKGHPFEGLHARRFDEVG